MDEKQTAKLIDQLQPTLTDLTALGMIIKQAHWNVTGPNFRPIHLHLDEIYAMVAEDVDIIAERIATLGVAPSGQPGDVVNGMSISEIHPGFLKDVEVVDLITDRLGHACRLIRERMGKIEDVDTVTADMLHQVLDGLEKQHWMLRSQAQ